MNIGILGASGFVGSHCSKHLRQNKIQVKDYLRRDEPIGNHDLILHFAQPNRIEPKDSFRDLVAEHSNKIKDLKNHCQHLAYISSAAIYGNKNQKPVQEATIPSPIDNYGKFKLLSEEVVLESFLDTDCLIIRPSNIYGCGMHKQTVLGDYLEQVRLQKMTISLRKAYPVRDFIHISDFVYGLSELIKVKAYGIFNISSGIPTSIKDLTNILDKHFGKQTIFQEESSEEIDCLVLDPAKTAAKTNWKKPKEFSDKFCYYLEHEIN